MCGLTGDCSLGLLEGGGLVSGVGCTEATDCVGGAHCGKYIGGGK